MKILNFCVPTPTQFPPIWLCISCLDMLNSFQHLVISWHRLRWSILHGISIVITLKSLSVCDSVYNSPNCTNNVTSQCFQYFKIGNISNNISCIKISNCNIANCTNGTTNYISTFPVLCNIANCTTPPTTLPAV